VKGQGGEGREGGVMKTCSLTWLEGEPAREEKISPHIQFGGEDVPHIVRDTGEVGKGGRDLRFPFPEGRRYRAFFLEWGGALFRGVGGLYWRVEEIDCLLLVCRVG